jgi:hypothetical protein
MATMTLSEFKTKHQDLIKRGMIRFTKELPNSEDAFPNLNEEQTKAAMSILSKIYNSPNMIVIDRFADDLKTILGEAKELKTACKDAKNMDYVNTNIGIYKLM